MTTECSICKTTKSKMWLACLGGWTLCGRCAKDYSDFTIQSKSDTNIVILMEVYFRRGQGESITYEQLHKEKSNYKFLTFKDLFEPKSLGIQEGK